MKKNQLKPYINQIRQSVVTYPSKVEVSTSGVEVIIERLIDAIYADRSTKGSPSPRKHVISQSLLKKFSHDELKETVHVNGYDKPVEIWNWLFCLPEENQNLWSQDIEVFFNFMEDHGSDALNEYITAFDSDISKLTTKYTNPLASYKEVESRLLFSLYLAMHLQRMEVFENNEVISDEDFLNEMKRITSSIFFNVWTWCKVSSATFIVPVRSVATFTSGNQKEYLFPVTPTLALFLSRSNWDSFLFNRYIWDDIRVKAGGVSAMESGLINSSEEVGQQKFMIQNGPTSYMHYHSNCRLQGIVTKEEFVFSAEIFSERTETKIKKDHPLYIKS